jgi:hypothetical protein
VDSAPVLDLQALLTGSQVAEYTGRTIQVVCNWRRRGLLPVATNPATGEEIRDERGRPLYRLLDAAKADARARRGAARMATSLARAAA